MTMGLIYFSEQNMDGVKSSVSTAAPLSSVHATSSWQYQLTYEMEKLSELRRQVVAQEERFHSLQQQFEHLSNDGDTAG